MRLFLAIIALFSTLAGTTQAPTRFQQELFSLRTLLEKTASYKQQINRTTATAFEQNYQRLWKSSDTSTPLARLLALGDLVGLIRDNHLGLYENAAWQYFRTKQGVDSFLQSTHFQQLPKVELNYDSLANVLRSRADSSVEGIYHYGENYAIGIFQKAPKEYIGIILESNVPYWQKGQVAAILQEINPHQFTAYYSHPLTRNFIRYSAERYVNQQLAYSTFYQSYYKGRYSKRIHYTDYINLPSEAVYFQTQLLDPNTTYLRIRSFSNNGQLRKQSDSLVQILENTPVTPYTIVDLRNNEGGSASMAKKYKPWITKAAKKGKVIVLINAGTISQGEITAYRLSKRKNVLLAGERTKGMVAYGSNYGRHIPLAGNSFSFYPTDTRTRKMLPLENYGVEPEWQLNNNSDWIDQILARLKNVTP